ncbi:Protein phosphatase 2C [Artemisia annua]|uniref:protein-serine/threonine phosphatase n=1 Tax=Artemisia annua TaxID=35608 RepID=A0A2U1Q8J5_ARTAN|nr:Protein phosphatase 2C [Artemisia annua]
MAASAEFSRGYVILEGGLSKDHVSVGEEEILQNSDRLKHMGVRKPPRHVSGVRHSISTATLIPLTNPEFGLGNISVRPVTDGKTDFLPVIRSGSCAEKGPKQYMEDEHICIDNLLEFIDGTEGLPSPGAFYGVFDGHGGTDAATYVRQNILKFILEDSQFPGCLENAIQNAFVKADHAFADNTSLDISSGTTALTALVFGRTVVVANAGDCRAVLGKRGKAFELSNDHKPNCPSEKQRIEHLGGVIYDGYLNGQLSVSRALGDWHMKGPKGSAYPLSAEPELQQVLLTEDDEFLIIGCDGLWDVMSSQCAVSITRRELMAHNDPERCSRELVREALKRNTCDNLTVIVICFSVDPPLRIEVPQSRVRRSISAEGLNFLKGVLDGNS